MKYRLLLFLLIVFCAIGSGVYAQQNLFGALRFQKSIGLYNENGIGLHYTDSNLFSNRMVIGAEYFTTRLGSAIGSNAIKQDNYLLSVLWRFMPNRTLQPVIVANAGWFRANLENEIFNDIPNSSMLASLETGFWANFKQPFKLHFSLGYNFISGDGMNKPGTLYPYFVNARVLLDIFSWKHKKE